MNAINRITKLRNSWKSNQQADEELKGAWANVNNMMFKGNITALMGASKLIAQMDWWNGLTDWIEFNTFEHPIVSKSIHIEERALYAYVILHCRHLALQSRTSTGSKPLVNNSTGECYLCRLHRPYTGRNTRLANGARHYGVLTGSIHPTRGHQSTTLDANIP